MLLDKSRGADDLCPLPRVGQKLRITTRFKTIIHLFISIAPRTLQTQFFEPIPFDCLACLLEVEATSHS